MPSYNSKIIKSEQASQSVSDYNAKKITHEIPTGVHPTNNFKAEYSGEATSFRMDELLKERTGIADKRQREVMDKVEETVIDKLKVVEEEAYKKAYELGLEEGTQQGLENAQQTVSAKLESLDDVIVQLGELRKTMFIENESAMVQLAYHLASKIAIRNINEDPAYIMECVENLIDSMQSDSKINLKVSQEDFDFIEEFKDRDLKTKDLFSNIKLFKEEALAHGECIFESNHGVVDASIPERLDKLWASISENLPKTENQKIHRQEMLEDTGSLSPETEEDDSKVQAISVTELESENSDSEIQEASEKSEDNSDKDSDDGDES